MHRRQGLDIVEGHYQVILVDPVRRDLFVDNLAENTTHTIPPEKVYDPL
jgi:hypothetical protein